MSIKRLFFDWSQPLLPQVAEWLAAKNPDGTVLDLRGMTVVLPGGRALRRLTELLVERATTRGLRLILPKLLTTGQLPEVLYTGEYREATSFERHMCWLQVLQRTDDEVLQPLIPKPPARNSIFPWFRLAQRLDALYADVAAGNLSFGDVAAHCALTDAAFADERWEILAQMADDFQETLHSHQLADVHAARKTAIEEERCSLDDELVLIGTSDLTPLLAQC